MVLTALYVAANVLLGRITRFSKLKRWGIDVAKRRGSKRAKVALARKIAVILHRMWVDGSTYRWTEVEGRRGAVRPHAEEGFSSARAIARCMNACSVTTIPDPL